MLKTYKYKEGIKRDLKELNNNRAGKVGQRDFYAEDKVKELDTVYKVAEEQLELGNNTKKQLAKIKLAEELLGLREAYDNGYVPDTVNFFLSVMSMTSQYREDVEDE